MSDVTIPETLVMNTRSATSALRDLATLLEHGDVPFVLEGLRKLADRIEEMAREQAEKADV